MPISAENTQYIHQQNENRLLWKDHDTPEQLRQMIFAEKIEWDVQYRECFVTDDLTALVLEGGDVLYLCARYRNKYGDLPSDTYAIEQTVIEQLRELGIDPDDAVDAKIIRNAQKYPDHIMSNGRHYEAAIAVCKQMWKAMGGDVAWSTVYLELLAVIKE